MTTTREFASRRSYGQVFQGQAIDGQPLRHGVFNEHQVRAAAGLTLVLGALAFAEAALGKVYWPIQFISLLFAVEFAARVLHGISVSPLGIVAGWLVRGRPPQWVSAKPKRFAWSLTLSMSVAMATITNLGICGGLPLAICLVCLVLLWLEAVLGLCLGCEIHALMVQRGWVARDDAIEICSPGTGRPGASR